MYIGEVKMREIVCYLGDRVTYPAIQKNKPKSFYTVYSIPFQENGLKMQVCYTCIT